MIDRNDGRKVLLRKGFKTPSHFQLIFAIVLVRTYILFFWKSFLLIKQDKREASEASIV